MNLYLLVAMKDVARAQALGAYLDTLQAAIYAYPSVRYRDPEIRCGNLSCFPQ